jgi:hypothetical protein
MSPPPIAELGDGLGCGGEAMTPVSRPGPVAPVCGGVTVISFAVGRSARKYPCGS